MRSDKTRATSAIAEMANGHQILITGANGFLGCHTSALAAQSGGEVLGIDLPGTFERGTRVRETLAAPNVEIHEVPSLDSPAFAKALTNFRPDMLIHLAGVTRRDNASHAWQECSNGNVTSTANVLAALSTLPVSSRPCLVMPGSQMEYGLAKTPWREESRAMPTSPYGVSKLAATEMVLAAGRSGVVRTCVARLALVYGAGQIPDMFVPELICKALQGIRIPMTSGEQQRRFAPAENMAALLIHIGVRLADGEDIPSLINAPACQPTRIIDIAKTIMTLTGREDALEIGALPQRENEQSEAWADTRLADSLHLPRTTSLNDALGDTVLWYRENLWFLQLHENLIKGIS